jgi:hypothetical protein
MPERENFWSQHWFANYIDTCNIRYQSLTGSSCFWEVHQRGAFPRTCHLRAEVEPVFKTLCLGCALEMEEAQNQSVWKSYSIIKLNAKVLEICFAFVIRSGDWSDSFKLEFFFFEQVRGCKILKKDQYTMQLFCLLSGNFCLCCFIWPNSKRISLFFFKDWFIALKCTNVYMNFSVKLFQIQIQFTWDLWLNLGNNSSWRTNNIYAYSSEKC